MTRRRGPTPAVSVVMPAYDAAATIGAAVSSVLTQSWTDWELLVVDDGSTDGTADLVGAVPDPRVRLLRQDNAGPAAARNLAMRASSARLIAFVDADDVLFDDYLDAALALWRQHGGIVSSNAHLLRRDGLRPGHTRHRGRFPRPDEQRLALLKGNFVSLMSLFPAELPDEIGEMDESLHRCEDWEFWLRAVFSGMRVSCQPRPMALLRRSGPTRTTDRATVYASEDLLMTRMYQHPDLTGAERAYLEHRLAAGAPGLHAERGDEDIRRRHYRAAARHYRTAATVTFESPVRAKSRLLSTAPRLAGPFLRHYHHRRD